MYMTHNVFKMYTVLSDSQVKMIVCVNAWI